MLYCESDLTATIQVEHKLNLNNIQKLLGVVVDYQMVAMFENY